MKQMTTYRVTLEGEFIKDKEMFFPSLKLAKDYMKRWYDFAKEWDAYLLVLTKITYNTKKDLEMGNVDSTHIRTRTTIMRL